MLRVRAAGEAADGAAPAALRQAGPAAAAPDYAGVDAQPLNRVVMALFRRKMAEAIGSDSQLQGYPAIIDLTRRLNRQYPTARDTQLTTRAILNSLFPGWLPGAFRAMFSRPLPALSCRLNAFATALTCQWLMGPCKVNDVEIDGGQVGAGMGVLVERCRYLEEAGCASICINSCKVPTQEFFEKDMGLPLTMTPNYDDFSCQFAFGKTPQPQAEDEAFSTPCFTQCPSRRRAFDDANGKPGDCVNIAVSRGKNLFVETPEFDVLAPHRPRDKDANKGEGLGFLFSCFACCGAPAEDTAETAATAERHYSLPPSESLTNLANKED
ncbi:hypothetical protein Rsub_04270 [Raphidocelis subcapitata]|uniref:Beta-carotene isomerase D27-like C-terminal domain-containing protein n=1 Tax=Raphidocelis subcapitata TaxID=307507 RepID=A0A2V0P122_9CHLO|nr:hypothetical protein Rsub_04270 [Raphidocelis subcapitata]|eukprot:GBF91530.1 hypothetical protein Rsub_04270 [Raphidocelis subcapitata]